MRNIQPEVHLRLGCTWHYLSETSLLGLKALAVAGLDVLDFP